MGCVVQSKRTKKVGIVGKFGTRYGASLRKQIKKIEVSQHSKYFCPFCGKVRNACCCKSEKPIVFCSCLGPVPQPWPPAAAPPTPLSLTCHLQQLRSAATPRSISTRWLLDEKWIICCQAPAINPASAMYNWQSISQLQLGMLRDCCDSSRTACMHGLLLWAPLSAQHSFSFCIAFCQAGSHAAAKGPGESLHQQFCTMPAVAALRRSTACPDPDCCTYLTCQQFRTLAAQYAMKRAAVGIWKCKACHKVQAGGAYVLK